MQWLRDNAGVLMLAVVVGGGIFGFVSKIGAMEAHLSYTDHRVDLLEVRR